MYRQDQEFYGEAEFEGGNKRGTFVKQKPMSSEAVDKVKYQLTLLEKLFEIVQGQNLEEISALVKAHYSEDENFKGDWVSKLTENRDNLNLLLCLKTVNTSTFEKE
jgi:hypothetical protein